MIGQCEHQDREEGAAGLSEVRRHEVRKNQDSMSHPVEQVDPVSESSLLGKTLCSMG